MATSDQEQKSINVPQHKRLAQGAPVNGQSMKDSGAKKSHGGLAHAKKK
jgi:hypothetical protein